MEKKTKSLADLAKDPVDNVDNRCEPKPKQEVTIPPDIAVLIAEDSKQDTRQIFTANSELTKGEKKFYAERRAEFMREFPNLNKSSDISMIHRVIMEEIIAERIYSLMLENPGDRDLSDKLTASNKRFESALEALGASRDKRIRNRETSTVSLADVVKEYFVEGKKLTESRRENRSIEDAAVEEHQEHLLGLQFGVIAKEEGIELEPDSEE